MEGKREDEACVDDQQRALNDCDAQHLCSPGEEKFGYVKSRLYALTLRWRRKFVEFVANDILSSNPRTVLDIGCGTCDVLTQLRSSEIELYGIDPSPHMLRLAKKNMGDTDSKVELSKVDLSLGNNRHIPFERKFDRIFSSLSFHHWKNREESIPYILTKLAARGEFTIYEYDRDALVFLGRTIVGKHALSERDVIDLAYAGYEKTIEHNVPYIVVRFKKKFTGSN